jgi:hypothetical protein
MTGLILGTMAGLAVVAASAAGAAGYFAWSSERSWKACRRAAAARLVGEDSLVPLLPATGDTPTTGVLGDG